MGYKPKFKIGDKVRYIGNERKVPGPCTIDRIVKTFQNYHVIDAKGIGRVFTENDLKLVKEK